MHENEIPAAAAPKRIPWNRGKLIGPRPPLRQKHVWAIRTRLQLERQLRGLALFNLAIDSKLRGCDLVAIRVDDIAPSGYAVERASVRQRKTGRSVRFELSRWQPGAVTVMRLSFVLALITAGALVRADILTTDVILAPADEVIE